MMSSRSAFISCSVLAMAAVVACTESSRRAPTAPSTTGSLPTRLEILGPGTVPVGKTGEFRAIAHQPDGTTRDATADAFWLPGARDVLASTAKPGAFTGLKNGETFVSVSLLGQSSRMTVIVTPEGTYRVMGTIRDAGIAVDAMVRVESGPTGQVDVQAPGGAFVIYGVAGDTRFTALKTGYDATTRTVAVNDHQRIDLDINPSNPRPNLGGNYRLTVTASEGCASLPDDGRSRSYDAVVQQEGPRLTVLLSGPEFVVASGESLNRFTGLAEPDRAVFSIGDQGSGWYYYYYYATPDVMEILSPSRYFIFGGTASTTIATDGLRGTLSGVMRVEAHLPMQASGTCHSTGHSFVMTR